MQTLINSWLKGNHKNLQTLRSPGNWVWHPWNCVHRLWDFQSMISVRCPHFKSKSLCSLCYDASVWNQFLESGSTAGRERDREREDVWSRKSQRRGVQGREQTDNILGSRKHGLTEQIWLKTHAPLQSLLKFNNKVSQRQTRYPIFPLLEKRWLHLPKAFFHYYKTIKTFITSFV